MWQLKNVAAAPRIVTARVVSAEKYERVPDGPVPWKNDTWGMTATVEVLRAFTESERQLVGSQLRIRYLGKAGSEINGPAFPVFEPGQVMIFPLQANANPLSEPSRLLSDQGVGLTIPVAPGMKEADDPPASGRAFVIREIANSLSTGTARDIAAVGGYLTHQFDDLSSDLMPLLSTAIVDDRERWAEVATCLLSAEGTPRSGVAELMGDKAAHAPISTSGAGCAAAIEGVAGNRCLADPHLVREPPVERLGHSLFSD